MKKTFRGGTHPPEWKLTADKAGEKLPSPATVYVPILQHIGAPGKTLVKKGDQVKLGQRLTDPGGFVSVPSHSPVSGEVQSVGPYPHPVGRDIESVVIQSDGTDEYSEEIGEDSGWNEVDPDTIRSRVRDAGLAGMGGAAFPTHVKLSPPNEKPINTVIINGAECEPYLTSDHRLMLERPGDILAGAMLVGRAVGADRVMVGVEDNKPDAVDSLRKAVNEGNYDIQIEMLPVKYPQGAEKQLIYALTGREVPPPPGLPMDVRCLVQNVGSCVAIYEAVRYNRPLVERYVTVTGRGVRQPKNLIARIGTPFSELIQAAGGYTEDAAKLLNGGPMMGTAQWTDMIPVIKGTSGIVVLKKGEAHIGEEQPCISCGRCVSTCPIFLMPTNIARLSEFERFEEAEAMGVLECIECGSCTFVCPSKRNLVHHIRFGKTTVMALKRKQAELAKSQGRNMPDKPDMEKEQPREEKKQNTTPDVNKAESSPDEAAPVKPKPKPAEKPAANEKEPKEPSRRFILSSSPHIRDAESVPKIMNTVIITLIPATLGATWLFGFRAFVLVLLGMTGALATEWLLQKMFKARPTISDGSAMLTGILLSFNLPAGVPWWIPLAGSFFAIAVAKMPFGGLGHNPLNPALAGRAFLLASWPLHMTKDWLPAFWWKKEGFGFFTWKVDPSSFLVDGQSYATPLEVNKTALKTVMDPGGTPSELIARAMAQLQGLGDRLLDLVLGNVGGCIGETLALLLLIGAAYLLYKNYIDWRTPFGFIAVVGIGGWLFGGSSGLFSGDMLFHIFAGGLILGAFYMATDMVTSPMTKKGRLIFGIGCGLITLMIRLIGGYPEGVSYAILLMNLTVPLIDRWLVPRRFGHVMVKGNESVV